MAKEIITFQELMEDIRDALCDAEGDEITEIYNSICAQELKYIGDSLWERGWSDVKPT